MTKEMPSMKPEDFFKEDFKSSPKYKRDPQLESEICQVRFKDDKKTQTLNRSHVGTLNDYDSYEKLVKAEKDFRQKEFQKRLRKSFAMKNAHFRQINVLLEHNGQPSASNASCSSKMSPRTKISNRGLNMNIISDPQAKMSSYLQSAL